MSNRYASVEPLEDALGALVDAQECLRCVALRMTSRMRTVAESEDVHEINLARTAIERTRRYLAAQHPQGQSS